MSKAMHKLPESMQTDFYKNSWVIGFTQITNDFITAKELSASQLRIILYLLSFEFLKKKKHETSRNQIAKNLSMSVNTTSNDLSYLIEHEYIFPHPRGKYVYYEVNLVIEYTMRRKELKESIGSELIRLSDQNRSDDRIKSDPYKNKLKNKLSNKEENSPIGEGLPITAEESCAPLKGKKPRSLTASYIPNNVFDAWNRIVVEKGNELATARALSDKRIKTILKASDLYLKGVKEWEAYFYSIYDCPFLLGQRSDFRASFDWVINPENVLKILEGKYTDTKTTISQSVIDQLNKPF